MANGNSKKFSILESLSIVCNWCFKSLLSMTDLEKVQHNEECKFRLNDMCMYCMRQLSNMNDYNRKTHVEHCRNKQKAKSQESTDNKTVKTSRKTSKLTKTASKRKKSETHDSPVGSRRCSQRLKRKLDEEETARPDENQTIDRNELINEYAETESNSEHETDLYQAESLRDKTKKHEKKQPNSFRCCQGYRPPVNFPNGETIYSNFPFQALDNDRENIKFVIVNGVFHNQNCFKRDYQLKRDSKEGTNRLCSDLAYHKYLQNILKRSQIMTNFSSIPHQYLTYNQLKMELNHYRDSIKKLKLDNLNLKRTIDSLRSKDESYRKFINMLATNDYSKLSQIISVCLNQKRGINGIIEKLLDSTEGCYRPREKDQYMNQPSADDVECKICLEGVSLARMRDHVARHAQRRDVEEHATRCGFCGQVDTCTISIRTGQDNSNKQRFGEPFSCWPESNCPYFKNFNLKMLARQEKSGVSVNKPIACGECSTCVWSFNLRAHYRDMHPEVECPVAEGHEFGNGFRNDDAPCKVCNEMCPLSKMRDHVARHILLKEVELTSSLCGFCGRDNGGCTIAIVITSGKGKNTTYGPASTCSYFRKFNLKSSAKPTKSSPSTNRPIECHICKHVCWSYNVRSHFAEAHAGAEEPPELITFFERELIYRS